MGVQLPGFSVYVHSEPHALSFTICETMNKTNYYHICPKDACI